MIHYTSIGRFPLRPKTFRTPRRSTPEDLLMHEATIVKALLNQLDALCARRQPAHLTRVTVEVGDRSGTNPDALAFIALDKNSGR